MGLAAVRVRIAGDDFHLLAEENSPSSADGLARLLGDVRDGGGTLRLRPRLAPTDAPWVRDEALDGGYPRVGETKPLTGEETPGTAWRDVLGESIQEIEPLDVDAPTALWHWAIGSDGDREIG